MEEMICSQKVDEVEKEIRLPLLALLLIFYPLRPPQCIVKCLPMHTTHTFVLLTLFFYML